MRKRSLQIATAVVATVPVVFGGLGLVFGARSSVYALPPGSVSALLDSNYRFLGGVWFGLGMVSFWLVPRIERETILFRAIWFAVFVGGIGRVISAAAFGSPPSFRAFFVVVEIVGAPIFIYWQHRVAMTTGDRAVASRHTPPA